MWNKEVLIGPFLESRIEFRIILVAHLLSVLVKLLCHFKVDVMWRHINSSTKPVFSSVHFKVTHIHVHNGMKWIFWVNYNRYSSGQEFVAIESELFVHNF